MNRHSDNRKLTVYKSLSEPKGKPAQLPARAVEHHVFLRQIRLAHQITVTLTRGAAAFIKSPDDEALATPTVTCGKDALDVRGVFLEISFCIAARVPFHAQSFEQRLLRSEEAHRQKDELRGQNFFRAGNILGDELAFVVLRPFHLHGV